MKKHYMQLLAVLALVLLGTTTLSAQIPDDSPIPVDVIIEIPETGFVRQIADYVSVSNSVEWGTQPLRQTVTGEVTWVNDDDIAMDGLDTLGCDTTTMFDYTDKIVLVRRGECFFSDKVYYAQKAGAKAVIIVNAHGSDAIGGMAAGDEKGLEVTIPSVFFNVPGDGDLFIPQLDEGATVIATFQVRGFFGELGPNDYATPQSQVQVMDSIQVELLNLSPEDPILDPSATVLITEPDGSEITLNSTIDTIRPDEIHVFEFDDYTPSAMGEYNMLYTNSVTDDSIARAFVVTDYTFQKDNGNIPEWPVDSWIAPGDDTFVDEAFLIYDFGNYYETTTEAVATHITFSLGNPDSIYVDGFPMANVFTLTIYDTDPDGDGVGPTVEQVDYSAYELVAEQPYVLTGDEEPYQLITIELDDPLTLKADGKYLVMAKYNGVFAALGIPPWYTYAGTESYPGFNTMVFTDQLYTDGWSGDYRAVNRLHLQGFVSSVDQFSPLQVNEFILAPNPAKEYINLTYDLLSPAAYMNVRILDMNGKLYQNLRFDNVKAGTHTFDVSDLPVGTYLLGINTPQGYKVSKFVVAQ